MSCVFLVAFSCSCCTVRLKKKEKMKDTEIEHSCGLSRWRPQFLQKFAKMKYFMIVYGLLGTIQAMSFVYFVATLTTLEKRFQIRSEITGLYISHLIFCLPNHIEISFIHINYYILILLLMF